MSDIKPWMFEFLTAFEGSSARDDYRWYLDQWTGAEARGFEGVFFSEHHFLPLNYSPSPNLLVAATAERTRTLRLGTMGNVVPMYEPWRLAEEYAMLDQMSGGRLEIGYAGGFGPNEFRNVGMSIEEARARFAEALDVIDGLLTTPRIDHRGRFWNLSGLSISPRPLQPPAPPRWFSGVSASSATLAARRGYRFCTGFLDTAAASKVFAAYSQAAREAGRAVDPSHLGLRRMVYIGDDAQEARAAGERALADMRAIMSGGDVPDAPRSGHSGPRVADEEVIAGDAAAVADAIIRQCRDSGAGHFLGYAVRGLDRARATRSHELWAEVNRRVRAA